MGPPIGNTNRLLHGARSKRYPCPLPYPGKKFANCFNQTRRYRRNLYTEVETTKGVVTESDADGVELAAIYDMAHRIAIKRIADGGAEEPAAAMRTAAWAAQRRYDVRQKLMLGGNGRAGQAGGIDVEGLYAEEPQTTPLLETEGDSGVAETGETPGPN